MVGQRKIWRRESGAIRAVWQCLYQERWNGVVSSDRKRKDLSVGEDISEIMNAVGKVQPQTDCSLPLPVQESRGHDMFSLTGNRPVKLLTEGCCVPKRLEEETGEALGRGECCGWQNRKTTAGGGYPPAEKRQSWETAGAEAGCACPAWHPARGASVYGTAAGRAPGWQDPVLMSHLAVKKAPVSGMWSGIIMHNAKKLD